MIADNLCERKREECNKKEYDYIEIRLKEDVWNYLKGYSSFEKCFDEITNSNNQSCHSIFDPNSSKYEKRYLTKPK